MIELTFGLMGCGAFLFASILFIGLVIRDPWLLIPLLLVWFWWATTNAAKPPPNDEPGSGC